MKQRNRVMLAAVLVAMTAAACAGPRQPEVRLEGVRIGGIGLRGGTLIFQVLVTNPNSFDLETRSLSYHLQLPHPTETGEWVSFAEGVMEESIRIDRRSAKILEVPVQFRYDDAGGAIRSIMDTGTLSYRVTGDVRLSEPIGRTFPYRHSGIVSLDGARD
jgi:LEA14-like dessication related protein